MYGENNPSHYQYHTWDQVGIDSPWQTSVLSEPKPVIHPAKYLDVRLTEMQGIPIYTPLYSGARRNVVPTGYVHGQFRDQLFQSPGNSSQVLPAGSARPGGKKDSRVGAYRPWHDPRTGLPSQPCRPGYYLKKVKGNWMCVLESSKKSRSR